MPTTATKVPKRSRHFMCLVYPESTSYDYTEVLSLSLTCGQRTAYILHDRDLTEEGEPKKDHYHVCVSFTNARTVQQVANMLHIPENHVEVSKRFEDGVLYLTHQNYPEKAQYSFEDIITNDKELCKCFDDRTEGEKVLAIVDCGARTLRERIMFASREGLYDVFRRNYQIISACIEEEKAIQDGENYQRYSK